ncbi:MAG: 30S ribosomal protein S1 [Clostridia bacterium]|nr:30S ribosomal protein S1 [Clostridia bacterium]
MEEREFYPEGIRLSHPKNRQYISTYTGLADARLSGEILEAIAVMCDAEHNLHVPLPCMPGIIPHDEGAVGIEDGTTRDIAIISRVGKPVSFVVIGFEETENGMRAILSRRRAQERCRYYCLNELRPGDILPARVTRLETFGAFCDVGCGLSALMPIAGMSVSRISHPSDRLSPGMDILGVITSLENGRICLSQRELLGTWEENAARFSQGETVMGIVRSVESYGVFIELAPNLAGLAETREDLTPGQPVSVYIKSVLPEKMKVKLIVIDTAGAPAPPPPLSYFITEGHLSRWVYSPAVSLKKIETVFDH